MKTESSASFWNPSSIRMGFRQHLWKNVETSNVFEKLYVKMNYYGPGTGNKDL